MKYAKPEIVLTADAASAIQNAAKSYGVLDNIMQEKTVSAYEADE